MNVRHALTRCILGFWVAFGLAFTANATPISYIEQLSNSVPVSGTYKALSFANVQLADYFSVEVPVGGTGFTGFIYSLSASERDLPNLVGSLRLYQGMFSDTIDLTRPLTELFFTKEYRGSYAGELAAGDYTVALNSSWSAYYDQPSTTSYTFTMFGIGNAPAMPIPEPSSSCLLLAGLLVVVTATFRRSQVKFHQA